jgi:hypothetical protein
MTCHVRLVSAPDRTDVLLGALGSDPGVSSLVVLPGAARHPGGDAVQFDVGPGSANSVFRHLKTFQDGPSNAVAVEYVDATLGEQPAPASKHFVVQRDLAPVWELVEARIRSDAVYAPSFYVLLGIAGLIGAVGILTNSQILIVGAMVVGPEYNAIMGVALGIEPGGRYCAASSPCWSDSQPPCSSPCSSAWSYARPGTRRGCTRSGSGRSPISSTIRTCSRWLSPCWPG